MITESEYRDRPTSETERFDVTPAMIQAGLDVYLRPDRDHDCSERVVREIFIAMAAAAPQEPSSRAAAARERK